MAERKIFAGGKLKRLRARLQLSQTQMAAELGLSPSYLNLMERNQRPLTVQVLMKLAAAYGIDAAELSADDAADMLGRLKEVFADPLLAGEIASPAELVELADAAPNAARGLMRLHEAYAEALERLSDLSHHMAERGEAPAEIGTRLPYGRAQAYFEAASPWFPDMEAAAEDFSGRLKPRDDPGEALKTHLAQAHGVDTRILPAHVMPVEQSRYDRHSQRLFLSERAPLIERPFLMARQAALLGYRGLLDGLTEEAGLGEAEAARFCRLGLARRLAEAMLAPAGRLSQDIRDHGVDPLRLSAHFSMRPWRAMARLAALGAAPGMLAPEAFAFVFDGSGTPLLRIAGAGFPFPRSGPVCPRLPVFGPMPPARMAAEEMVLPDGAAFLVVAVAEDGAPDPAIGMPQRRALIGWRREDAGALRLPSLAATRPIGTTCRLCERLDCGHRVHPPVARPGAFRDFAVGPSDYEIA